MNHSQHGQDVADGEFFFTEATEPILVRRGDPLGFRAAADNFADMLAPGLSNRTYDARWLSLLSWILVHVSEARKERGFDDSGDGLDQRRDIYRWIRPLELMWISRAVTTFSDNRRALGRRQLPGRTAVASYVDLDEREARWGLTPEQYERYRFAGPHGAYRGILGELDGLTIGGDGHRPGRRAERLARFVDQWFPVRHPARGKGPRPAPEVYWRKAWPGWNRQLKENEGWLPQRWSSGNGLRAREIELLAPPVFDLGNRAKRRRLVAELAAAASAGSHQKLVRALVTTLSPHLEAEERPRLSPLPAFSALADAGVDAMVEAWEALRPPNPPSSTTAEVAELHDCRAALEALQETACLWRSAKGEKNRPTLTSVAALADRVGRPRLAPLQVLRALLEHHAEHGGGRRWFKSTAARISSDVPTAGEGARPYRFRLWSLGRLAVQLNVAQDMPKALRNDVDQGDEEDGEKS